MARRATSTSSGCGNPLPTSERASRSTDGGRSALVIEVAAAVVVGERGQRAFGVARQQLTAAFVAGRYGDGGRDGVGEIEHVAPVIVAPTVFEGVVADATELEVPVVTLDDRPLVEAPLVGGDTPRHEER